jgi:hypothetical protein
LVWRQALQPRYGIRKRRTISAQVARRPESGSEHSARRWLAELSPAPDLARSIRPILAEFFAVCIVPLNSWNLAAAAWLQCRNKLSR